MKILSLIVLAAFAWANVDGLYCFTCINAKSSEDCQKNGEYKKCMKNELMCHNSVRKGPFGTMITKRCKQGMACMNNHIQNPRAAWGPSQCNKGIHSSVCRCCCSFDGCNGPDMYCYKNPGCDPIPAPLNGSKKCNRRIMGVGTVCKFQCDAGYEMEGRKRSRCVRRRKSEKPLFNKSPPTCKPAAEATLCPELKNIPENSELECTDGFAIGSVCTIACNPGSKIKGSNEITCLTSGEWDFELPTCEPLTCNQVTNLADGSETCNLSNNLGSICTFTCDSGFAMVGSVETTCEIVDGNPAWSEPTPTCELLLCDSIPPLANGDKSCTSDVYMIGTTCTHSCESGFGMVGSAETTCEMVGDNLTWSDPQPTCEPLLCDSIPPLTNGDTLCTLDVYMIGTTCTHSCDSGFGMVGSARTTCEMVGDNPTWSDPLPTCEPLLCDSIPPLTNGDITCTSDVYMIGTTCTHSCDSGFGMVGSAETTCEMVGDNPTWSDPQPTCEPLLCGSIPPLTNGDTLCTLDVYMIGTTCTHSCDSGFGMVGSARTTCEMVGDNPTWSDPLPTCEPLLCDSIPPLTNGDTLCTLDVYMIGTTCTHSCESGFGMVGSAETTCEMVGDNPTWSDPLPTCEPLLCDSIPPLTNGDTLCTLDVYMIGTTCTHSCDSGFGMVGSARTTCEMVGDNPTWSDPLPTCEPLLCGSIPPLTNGDITCTSDVYMIGTTCTHSCESGFGMVGSAETTCEMVGDNPTWSDPQPTCEPLLCDSIPPLTNGDTLCTLDVYMIGTTCTHSCDSGFGMVGSARTTCEMVGDNPTWSDPLPTCEPLLCDSIPPLTNGDTLCTLDVYMIGTTCTHSCESGFGMVGSAETTCEMVGDNPTWSDPLPTCEPLLCDSIPPLTNGDTLCTLDVYMIGTTCIHSCDSGFSMVGSAETTCEMVGDNPTWSDPLPTCEQIQCESEPFLYNGNITCTDENMAGSTCTYTCNDDIHYSLFPADLTTNQCLDDGTWSNARPCCYANCDQEPKFDALIILDSSSSVGAGNFLLMKEFVKDLVSRFDIGVNASRVGVFRYNRDVDSDSQIHLSDYLDDKTGLLDAIDKIPYDGRGTLTGRALYYARSEFREEKNGNRGDVHDLVVLITDGRASDNVARISEGLRRDAVTVTVVGVIPPRGRLDEEQLKVIATTPDDLVIVEDGFSGLNADLFKWVSNRFCVEGCL